MDAGDARFKVNSPGSRFHEITPSCMTTRFVWLHLPLELRLAILEYLSCCQRQQQLSCCGHRRSDRAVWASVCKEWQMFFELQTFDSLHVTSCEVDALGRIVTAHRRQIVKTLKFSIHLSTYTCADGCDKPESQSTIEANNKLFTKALWELFSILARWDIVSDQPTLRLEITAGSPSDQRHGFEALGNKPPGETDLEHEMIESSIDTPDVSVSGGVKRVLLNQLDLTLAPGVELPKVPIIGQVEFPWDSFRSLSAESLGIVLGCMPRLQFVRYGALQGINQHQQERRDTAMSDILNSVGTPVRSVLIYEQFATEGARRHRQGSPPPEFQTKGFNSQLVSAAVEASYRLESLGIGRALNVDAESFFQHIEAAGSHQSWPTLKLLGLYTWSSSNSKGDVNRLGLAAAKVALRMPEMEALTIATGGTSYEIFLRYRACRKSAELTVKVKNLDQDVVKAWKRVARRSGARPLEILFEA